MAGTISGNGNNWPVSFPIPDESTLIDSTYAANQANFTADRTEYLRRQQANLPYLVLRPGSYNLGYVYQPIANNAYDETYQIQGLSDARILVGDYVEVVGFTSCAGLISVTTGAPPVPVASPFTVTVARELNNTSRTYTQNPILHATPWIDLSGLWNYGLKLPIAEVLRVTSAGTFAAFVNQRITVLPPGWVDHINNNNATPLSAAYCQLTYKFYHA